MNIWIFLYDQYNHVNNLDYFKSIEKYLRLLLFGINPLFFFVFFIFLCHSESSGLLLNSFETLVYVLFMFVCDFVPPESDLCLFKVAEFSFTN